MRSSLLALLTAPALLVGCGGGDQTDDGPTSVAAAAYPFAWLVEQVGGADVEVTNLVEPGVEPHDVELPPGRVADLRRSDLVVYLKGFQPAVDDAVDGDNGLDLSTLVQQADSLEEEGENDPHVWLDPVLMQSLATGVAARLAEVDPEHRQGYDDRARAVVARLEELDRQTRAQLGRCASRDVVTSHVSFAYFAKRYGLVQRGIAGLSPEAEPSPRRLAEIARFARANDVTTIFFERLVSPKLAETVAGEVGASTAVLDPLEGVQGADDYLSVMRRNAEALRQALRCT